MAEVYHDKEIQEDVETRISTRPKSELPDHKDPKVQNYVDNHDDGCKTPTSPDQKIPAIKQCPPAPIKPKSEPKSNRRAGVKRKLTVENAVSVNGVPVDFSREIESFFEDLDRWIKKSQRKEEDREY